MVITDHLSDVGKRQSIVPLIKRVVQPRPPVEEHDGRPFDHRWAVWYEAETIDVDEEAHPALDGHSHSVAFRVLPAQPSKRSDSSDAECGRGGLGWVGHGQMLRELLPLRSSGQSVGE